MCENCCRAFHAPSFYDNIGQLVEYDKNSFPQQGKVAQIKVNCLSPESMGCVEDTYHLQG